MDNQHKKITGYRDLSQAEIDAMNRIKALANEVGATLDGLPEGVDGRWVAIARTQLQQGFMAAVRAVARPESF